MNRSLSLIDPTALSSALARAGVRDPNGKGPMAPSEAEPAGSPPSQSDENPPDESSLSGEESNAPLPSAYLGPAIPSNLAEFQSNFQPRVAPRNTRPTAAPQQSSALPKGPQLTEPAQPAPKKALPELPAIFLEPASTDGTPSRASRLDIRLEGYMDWVEQYTGCAGVFVVDEEGLVLMEKGSDPTLVALSAYFLRFQDRIRSLESQIRGSIAIDLEGEQILYVVQADTHLGLHALGFTVSEPLMPSVIQRFQTALPYVFQRNI